MGLDLDWIRGIVLGSRINDVTYRGRRYLYIVNEISTGVPIVHPKTLEVIGEWVRMELDKVGEIDYILTFEAMGIHVSSIASIKTGIPFIIAKKKRVLGDMLEVDRGRNKLYIARDIVDSRIVILDSIISTGDTVISTVRALRNHNVDVRKVLAVIDRMDMGGSRRVRELTGIDVESMVKIWVKPDGVSADG